MSYGLGMVLAVVVTGLSLAGLLARTQEAREIFRAVAVLVGFWTILLAIII